MDRKGEDKLGKLRTNGLRNSEFANSYDVDTDADGVQNSDEVGSFTSLDLNSDHHEHSTQEKDSHRLPNSSTIKSAPARAPDNHFTISDKDTDNDEPNESNNNIISLCIVKLRELTSNFYTKYKKILRVLWIAIPIILIHVYLIVALEYNIRHDLPFDCCNGVGFLFILYGLCVWSFFYYFVLKRVLGRRIKKTIIQPTHKVWKQIWSYWYTSAGLAVAVSTALVIFLAVDTYGQRRRLISAGGVLVIIFVGLIFSKNPERIRWRHVIWALALQFLFGLLILRWENGRIALDCLSSKVKTFLEFTFAGTDVLYGYLSTGQPAKGLNFPDIFVFRALCVIYFFGFVISILYHYGAMQWVIVKLGWLLQVTIGTTAAESMSAAANIFVGLVEAPLLIKPFLNDLTNSELNAVMTAGFATIAGTVMATYISLGISAAHLLSASVMAAPAALGIAKLIYPEAKESKTTSKEIKLLKTEINSNVIDAAAQGAMQGTILIGCIVANVIAFLAFVAFLNAIVSWLGGLVGITDLTFESILGKCFIPVAFIIGIDPEEVDRVGTLLGLKIVANEFIAYDRLVELTKPAKTFPLPPLSPRAQAITTFALCSFANVGSLGIQLGGLGALLTPERRGDLAKTIGRAFLGGILVGFLNACIAGSLLPAVGYAEWMVIINSTATVTNATTLSPVTDVALNM